MKLKEFKEKYSNLKKDLNVVVRVNGKETNLIYSTDIENKILLIFIDNEYISKETIEKWDLKNVIKDKNKVRNELSSILNYENDNHDLLISYFSEEYIRGDSFEIKHISYTTEKFIIEI